MGQAANLVRQYADAYSDGSADSYGSTKFLSLFAEDAKCSVAPTAENPAGVQGGLEIFTDGIAANEAILRNRKIELLQIVEQEGQAAWTGIWSARIGVEGLPMPIGYELRVHMAAFTEAKDGLIVRHREYLTTPEAMAT